MIHSILGLHHVTATVDDAQSDLDFCIDLLGMRLVKKTVNFDNHHVYHFYYGDERGTPGTIWTTFPYKDHGVRAGVQGVGQRGLDILLRAGVVTCFWRRPLESMVPRCARPSRDSAKGSWPPSIPPVSGSNSSGTDTDGREPWTGNGVDDRASHPRPPQWSR